MTILVLDIGTSSVRALLFDDDLHHMPDTLVSKSHQFTSTPPGAAIFDAFELQKTVESCIDEILTQPQAEPIQVVGMDTLVGNVVGIDGNNQPVTPVYLYADTRAAANADQLRREIDLEAARQRTGCILHTAYHPPRLHWLKNAHTDLFNRVERWVDVGAWLYTNWFGAAACSYSVASWSGLLNRADLAWDETWLNLLELEPDRLATLRDYSDVQTGLRAEYAQRWPVLSEVPFTLAVGDGAAANVGSGCVDRTQIALTVGTTAAMRTITNEKLPRVPDGLWSYRVDAEHHLIGGATSEGGSIFQWATDTLALNLSRDELESRLSESDVDGHGLTVLPLLAGERSPGWATNATGSIIGLRLSTTPLDILQAALEGVALRLALLSDQVHKITEGDTHIIASGGALASSPAWTQIISSALNRPLHITAEQELTARGTALLAKRAIGNANLNDFPPKITHTVEPDERQVKRLRAAGERQVQLYNKIVSNEN